MLARRFTGPGLRRGIRGSSSAFWTPAQLGSKLKLWLDGDVGVVTSSGKVTTWTDRVAAHAFVQAVDGERPLTRAINGHTAIDFDGTDDTLVGPTKATIGIGVASAQEVVAVYLADAVGAFTDVEAPGLIGDQVSVWGLTVGAAAVYYNLYNAAVAPKFATSGTAPSTATVYRARGTFDGTDSMTAKNGAGAVGTTGSVGGHNGVSGAHVLQLGAAPTLARYFNGCIGEIVACDVALTTPERAQLDQYLAFKWGAAT